MQHARSEKGIALVLAIFALVVVGGLVAGAFFVGMQEQTVGKNMVKQQQAFAAADGGAQALVANWSTGSYNNLSKGNSTTVNQTWLGDNSGWYRGNVKRLNDMLFLVTSEGFSRDSQARQRVGAIVRLRTIQFNINAALKTEGSTTVGGSTNIDGSDHTPSGWTGCPALEPNKAGIRINDTTKVTVNGSGSISTYVTGSPTLYQDTTLNPTSLTTFGDQTFDQLTQLATKTIAGGVTLTGVDASLTGAACNTGDQKNWGDPTHPTAACGNYWPIVWITNNAANTSINGNQGQGILLVSGDLSVQGGFDFYGPVIIRGHLKTTGTGGHFNGGVVAADVDLEQNTVLGNAVINYNSCALVKALTNSAVGGLMKDRSWININ
jgi:hypothetical protein